MGFDGVSDMLPNEAIPDMSDTVFSAAWAALGSTAAAKGRLYTKIQTLPASVGGAAGAYTPGASNANGINPVTPGLATYLRIGGFTFVSGTFSGTTQTAPCGFNLGSPVAANVTVREHVGGMGANYGTATRSTYFLGDNTVSAKVRTTWNQGGTGGTGGISYVYVYRN